MSEDPALSNALGKTIAFIGGGNMTEALIAGLLKGRVVASDQVWATDILEDRVAHLHAQYQVRVGMRNAEAAGWGQLVVLSVEPDILDSVLKEVRGAIGPDSLVISVAAGYPIARIAGRLKNCGRIVRAMPNTPCGVLAGATAVCAGPGATPDDLREARAIFESVGRVLMVEERLMDAVTGLSGSGPAYIYVMIEALADGGVRMGLPRPVADLLAAQTVLGAARAAIESGEHPGRLKDRVASPGGTTIAGLQKLEDGRVRAALINAVEAAAARSHELAQG